MTKPKPKDFLLPAPGPVETPESEGMLPYGDDSLALGAVFESDGVAVHLPRLVGLQDAGDISEWFAGRYTKARPSTWRLNFDD